MITSCFRSDDGSVRADLSHEELRAAVAGASGLLWVDIVAEDGRAEGEPLLHDVFGFHPLTIDDCYNTLLDPPKVDDYGDYLFMIVHHAQLDDGASRLSTSELDLYLGAHYVVSLHKQPLASIAELRQRAESGGRLMTRGSAFLAHALFDAVVDDFHPVVEALDDRVDAAQAAVLERPVQSVLQEVLALKRMGLRLKRTILPQRDVANRFARGEYSRLVPPEALFYFRDIYDHTVRLDEMIDHVRDLSDSALNTYLSSVNNRTNEVMKTLAIVTVVFLPMTLLASVYGTNFEETLPSYGWGAGFYFMLAAFVAIAIGLYLWFRWRRWV
jgi:magnesium transporter